MSSSSSASDVSSILQPLTIGQLILRNRIAMAALTRSRSVPTNVPNDINLEYYVQRARGGTGLIVSEGTLIVQQGTEWQNVPGLWSNEQVMAWKKITDAVHAESGLIFAQLWHLGRSCHPDAPEQLASGKPVYAPSAVAARGGKFRFLSGEPGFVTPTAIDDPRVQIEEFKQAAIHAKEAGFDGVELHGAGGYLVHQFLDSTSNIRTDSWGGSIENRCRFGLEALKELVSIWGNKKVAVKLDPSGGYNDIGMPLQETLDTFSYFITEADRLDLAYISLVRYTPGRDVMYDGKLRNTPHDVLASYRPFIKRSALFLNGGLTSSEAVTLVASGQIDAAVFGRLFIGHPDIAKRLERGLPLDAKMDYTRFYGHGPHLSMEEQRRGYSDYSEVAL